MNQGTVTPELIKLVEHREEVIKFVRQQMRDQGATKLEAAEAVACIMFWEFRDTENLYKCITSGLDEKVIKAIVAHDYNGLSKGPDPTFAPKSRQFEEEK